MTVGTRSGQIRPFPFSRGAAFLFSAAILSAALVLPGCGGGSGGGGSATAVTGQAIDAPISNATITVTLNAPLNQAGAQVLGTTKANGQGDFSLTIPFPNTSAPVFANAQSGTSFLSSYLGPSNTLASLSQLTINNVPDLAISQVTTGALAILAATGSLSSLTPSAYATLLSQHRSDILDAAAGIMAVVDAQCNLPTGDSDTFEMAENMVKNTTATNSSSATATLTRVSTSLSSSCTTTLQNLLQAISASQTWAPELDLGDVVENISPVVPAGTYILQGLLADTGISPQTPAVPPASSVAAPSVFNDTTVSVSSSGAITSTSGNVSGQVTGNFVTLTLTAGGSPYSFSGKAGILPSAFLSGTTAEGFSIRSGGQLSSGTGDMMKLDAVLVPSGAVPAWGGIQTSSQSEDISCPSGQFGLKIHGLGPTVGGTMYPACGTPSATTPFLTLASGGSGEDELSSSTSTLQTLHMVEESQGTNSYPFILDATAVSLATVSSGTLFYVMGANEMLYSFTASGTTTNTTFLMNENPLDHLSESSNGHSDH